LTQATKRVLNVKVLLSSSSYPQDARDWRSRFIDNMVVALANRSDMELALWAPTGTIPGDVLRVNTLDDTRWLTGLSHQGGIAHLLRSRHVFALGTVVSLMARLARAYRRHNVDVVHANWLQNALPLWGTHTPALITVLGSDFGLLRIPGMRLALRAMLRQRKSILAPNAQWMVPTLRQAFGDLAEVRPILFGVDSAWFDVQRAPAADGVQHWLAITRLTRSKVGDLFNWGYGLFGPQRQLHLFGPMQEAVHVPTWVQYHGPTHPRELQQTWFPKAAGLITLSRHDEGRPQVMLEAMASGLPVVASSLPAHCDMVQHRQTGWLTADSHALIEGLDWLEVPLHNQQAGQAARQWIKDTIGTWDDCAARYATAYRELLEPRV
jgi:hypothetical protein